MRFREAIKSAFSKYVIAEGRACRSEFWFFTLFNILVPAIIFVVVMTTRVTFIWRLIPIYGIAILLPWISVLIRRLHDVGQSGWMYLLVLIPITGAIAILIWLCSDSQSGSNKYGPNPKEKPYIETE